MDYIGIIIALILALIAGIAFGRDPFEDRNSCMGFALTILGIIIAMIVWYIPIIWFIPLGLISIILYTVGICLKRIK